MSNVMLPTQTKRISAIKVADKLNMIEGALVSNFAKENSAKLAKGEITGEKNLIRLRLNYPVQI